MPPHRGLSLLQAVSLNMSMMVGVGPFITIPAFVATMNGPQAMIGWLVGAVVAIADGLVWSELAAAFPGSGGTFHFFDAIYGRSGLGRLLKFLFVWQFLFSGPLEVATGAQGFTLYVSFLIPALKETAWTLAGSVPVLGHLTWSVTWSQVLAVATMAGITALAYRRIEAAGRLMVALWIGMLLTVGTMIATTLWHFDPRLAFAFPPDAWRLNSAWAFSLGAAMAIATYDFLGYYQICYLGDEVRDPSRVLPRAIVISVVTVSLIYLSMNLGILGVLPWERVVKSDHIASDVIEHIHGITAAHVITLMIIWTGTASTFAALLGYSRIPYAAARSGHFFRMFARLHPSGDFPHRSLLAIGALACLACLADLVTIIAALLTSRIVIQFVGQIVTVAHIHRRPELSARLVYRMPWFPLPALLALVGWLWIFATSGRTPLVYGLASLGLGLAAFVAWDRSRSGSGDTIDALGETGTENPRD